jgi:SOS-response transcriptional repressor LexA
VGGVTQRDVRIEHRYASALGFVQQHGADALVILHDLLAHAEEHGRELVATTSVREIADRLGFLSKDTVHRRLRRLMGAGIVRPLVRGSRPKFDRPAYVLHLDNTGISLTTTAVERSW